VYCIGKYVLVEFTTFELLYLFFMCCAGYERCEGSVEKHWEEAMAVFMIMFSERDVLFL
jgi:hypothetical protein